MKILKYFGYTVLVLISIWIVFMCGLYIRYKTQQSAIVASVDTFIEGIQTDSREKLVSVIHPEMFDRFTESIQGNVIWDQIIGVDEAKRYFSYSIKYGFGESTEFIGDLIIDNGQRFDVMLKLMRMDGVWKVYAIELQDKQK